MKIIPHFPVLCYSQDIQLTGTNDDHYFVFEDALHQVTIPKKRIFFVILFYIRSYSLQVLLCFFRDTEVLKHFENSSATPCLAVARGNTPHPDALLAYPPCGVTPFHGFSMYGEGITI